MRVSQSFFFLTVCLFTILAEKSFLNQIKLKLLLDWSFFSALPVLFAKDNHNDSKNQKSNIGSAQCGSISSRQTLISLERLFSTSFFNLLLETADNWIMRYCYCHAQPIDFSFSFGVERKLRENERIENERRTLLYSVQYKLWLVILRRGDEIRCTSPRTHTAHGVDATLPLMIMIRVIRFLFVFAAVIFQFRSLVWNGIEWIILPRYHTVQFSFIWYAPHILITECVWLQHTRSFWSVFHINRTEAIFGVFDGLKRAIAKAAAIGWATLRQSISDLAVLYLHYCNEMTIINRHPVCRLHAIALFITWYVIHSQALQTPINYNERKKTSIVFAFNSKMGAIGESLSSTYQIINNFFHIHLHWVFIRLKRDIRRMTRVKVTIRLEYWIFRAICCHRWARAFRNENRTSYQNQQKIKSDRIIHPL